VDRIVVMPTPGGQLQIATVTVDETFTLWDSKTFATFDLGTTFSEARPTASYRYHINMANAWPLRIIGEMCVVKTGAVEPTLPMALTRRRCGGERPAAGLASIRPRTLPS